VKIHRPYGIRTQSAEHQGGVGKKARIPSPQGARNSAALLAAETNQIEANGSVTETGLIEVISSDGVVYFVLFT
jgi:hypothetical protein